VRRAIDVSREKKGDTSVGRCRPESGKVSMESARQGESNDIGFEASAWPSRSAGRKRQISQQADVCQSREGSYSSAKKISLRYLHFSAPCIFWLRSVGNFFEVM